MMAPMPGYAAGMAPVAYAYPPEYAAMPGEQQWNTAVAAAQSCRSGIATALVVLHAEACLYLLLSLGHQLCSISGL